MVSPHVFCFETAGSQCIEMVLCTVDQWKDSDRAKDASCASRAAFTWTIGHLSCSPRRKSGRGRRHSDSLLFTTVTYDFSQLVGTDRLLENSVKHFPRLHMYIIDISSNFHVF